MATDVADLLLRIDATTEGLRRELAKAEKSVQAGTATIDKSTKRIDQRFMDMGAGVKKSLNKIQSAIGAVAAALAIREVVRYADAWQNVTNQLKTVQKETEDLTHTQNLLMESANRSRSGFESTANLYTRLARSTESMNLTQIELIALTETINKSFAVSGATSQEAANAITQLSQGLAAGALRGEEFNSVSEQSPILMQAIADSLKMTRGELRAFAAEGGITSEIVVKALQQASGEIDQTFSKMSATFGQNMEVAKNNLLEFVGSSETVKGATSAFGSAIVSVTEFIVGFTRETEEATKFQIAFNDAVSGGKTDLERHEMMLKRVRDAVAALVVDKRELIQIQLAENLTVTNNAELIQMANDLLGENARQAQRRAQLTEGMTMGQMLMNSVLAKANELEQENQQELKESTEETKRNIREVKLLTNVMKLSFQTTEQKREAIDKLIGSLSTVKSSYSDFIPMLAETEWRMQGVKDAVDDNSKAVDFWTAVSEDGAKRRERAEEEAARVSQRNWERTHEFVTNTILDIADNGGSAFERLGDIAVATAKRIAAEWLALKALNLFGITPSGGGFNFGGGGSGGGLLGSLGGLFSGGGSSGGIGAGADWSTGVPTQGGGGFSLGNVSPLGWAALGITAIGAAKHFSDPDQYKRSFAGLLTAPTAGAAGMMFDAGTFASGFRATGVAHRASQQQALAEIERFRQVDAMITEAVRAAGGNIDLSGATLSGVGIEGQAGSQGTFLGRGGMTTAQDIEQMLTMFTGELLNHVTGLDEELLKSAKAASSVEEAVKLLTGSMEKMAKEAGPELTKMQEAQKKAAEAVVAAYDSGLSELDSVKRAFLSFQQYAERGLTSEAIANFTGLLQSEIDAVLARGKMAVNNTRTDVPYGGFTLFGDPQQRLALLGLDGSHADGLNRVPYDGYRAELHSGERVLTKSQADSMDSMAGKIAGVSGKMETLTMQMALYIKRTNEIIDNWDKIGLPPERAA
jgi:tape measure domain-containing protein